MYSAIGYCALAATAYHLSMNTLRLLTCVAVFGAFAPVFADPVNQCRDARGRIIMTDRPCGNPSVERPPERQSPLIVVEQIQAEDIFSARTRIRDEGEPMSRGLLERAGKDRDQGKGDTL
ncbi:DUF4124 domain-containing protein [Variovorax fucosicus]|uniref:DUF4124 domain-containing protein n=2 Tax=Variovorax fucosicus TaxID=3053517 RepID=UPI003365AC6F